MKNTKLFFGLSLMVAVMFTQFSCAKWQNRVDADGGIFGSTAGRWIVLKQSGGVITDVYLLDNVMVQSEQGSDGWLFKDEQGNPVHVGGDVKAIRITAANSDLWGKYHEYHQEFEPDGMTYGKKFNSMPK